MDVMDGVAEAKYPQDDMAIKEKAFKAVILCGFICKGLKQNYQVEFTTILF
jgi:hypothetical protein